MRFLAIEFDILPLPAEQKTSILRDEAIAVLKLYQEGIIREISMTDNGTHAVIILECANEEQCRRVLASLPLVEGGYIQFEVRELTPYLGYNRLIEKGCQA